MSVCAFVWEKFDHSQKAPGRACASFLCSLDQKSVEGSFTNAAMAMDVTCRHTLDEIALEGAEGIITTNLLRFSQIQDALRSNSGNFWRRKAIDVIPQPKILFGLRLSA